MTLNIQQMSRSEKLQVMESIWADLSRFEADVESPEWHAEVLNETKARVTEGKEEITDWEAAKKMLRKRFE